jgi:hypothetical protein
MATKLSELRDKFEKLTPGTKEYNDTLALIQAEQNKIKSRSDEIAQEKEKKDAQKAAKEKKSDLELIQTLETYIQKRKDLGDTVPEKIQIQYNNLKKKYPTETSQASGGNESGYYSGSTFVPGKQSAPTPTAETPSTGKTPSKPKVPTKEKQTPVLTDAEQRAQALETAGTEDFALPETIFNNVPSLKTILDRYVKEDWTESKLRKAIRDDVWYRQNSGAIKQRYVQLFNYRDLVNTGRAQGTTQYEQDIVKLERQIADKARQMGSGIASDPAALRKAAENMYITNVGIDDAMTTDFIAAAIRPIGSTIAGKPTQGYSGQALKDYQEIQGVAKANGFRVKDIVPGGQTEEQVLQGIATGRIDANRLAQDARKLAAQGQPEYVRDLLGQGYNLDQIYSPYRQTMANILEVNQDEIDLNDQTLRSAITDKGDMNIYDFKKTLKADSRWQYTENAKQEVSDVAFQVLRDFGFQG